MAGTKRKFNQVSGNDGDGSSNSNANQPQNPITNHGDGTNNVQFASASVAVPDLQTAVNSTVPAGTGETAQPNGYNNDTSNNIANFTNPPATQAADNAQPAGTGEITQDNNDNATIAADHANPPAEDPNKPKRAKCSIEDYNRRAETKVKTSRRTGQACNRCRGRKARGVSAPRGALQAAQEENARLQAENERLMLENEQLHNELARYRATYPELPANNDQSNQPKVSAPLGDVSFPPLPDVGSSSFSNWSFDDALAGMSDESLPALPSVSGGTALSPPLQLPFQTAPLSNQQPVLDPQDSVTAPPATTATTATTTNKANDHGADQGTDQANAQVNTGLPSPGFWNSHFANLQLQNTQTSQPPQITQTQPSPSTQPLYPPISSQYPFTSQLPQFPQTPQYPTLPQNTQPRPQPPQSAPTPTSMFPQYLLPSQSSQPTQQSSTTNSQNALSSLPFQTGLYPHVQLLPNPQPQSSQPAQQDSTTTNPVLYPHLQQNFPYTQQHPTSFKPQNYPQNQPAQTGLYPQQHFNIMNSQNNPLSQPYQQAQYPQFPQASQPTQQPPTINSQNFLPSQSTQDGIYPHLSQMSQTPQSQPPTTQLTQQQPSNTANPQNLLSSQTGLYPQLAQDSQSHQFQPTQQQPSTTTNPQSLLSQPYQPSLYAQFPQFSPPNPPPSP
ncbi:hypothetical protein MW887_006635 [Aspergillus wentii]|nr:hypothetical protein MW887_006635 [Aspergillus wentii]